MKNKTLRLSLVTLAVLAAACAGPQTPSAGSSSGGRKPAWVEGESADYPRSAYVLGVGSGDDEGTASDRARGEISRVFSSAVSVDTSLSETEENVKAQGRENSSFSQTVAQQIRTASKKMLEGVEIPERWKDSSSGRWYALAALSRGKALAAVDERMRALDEDAALWKGKMDAAGDKFERAKAAAKLSTLLKARLELENDRRVLGGGSLASPVDAASARAEAAKALAALDVVVAVTGDGGEDVETGIVSGLTAAGLRAKRGSPGDAGDLIAEVSASVAEVEIPDTRWKRSRATAVVTLKEGRENKAFTRFDVSERQDAGDKGESRRRALSGLAKQSSDKVKTAIEDYFANN